MNCRFSMWGGAALVLAAGVLAGPADSRADPDRSFGRPHIDAVKTDAKVLKDGRVVSYGKTFYRGEIDVNTTLERVRKGKKLDHRNDGAFFRNREGKLPKQ